MPRRDGSGGQTLRTIRSKGYSRRGNGVGSYSRNNKKAKADRYDRPALDRKGA